MTNNTTPDISFFLAVHQHIRTDLDRYVDAISAVTEGDRGGRLDPLKRWTTGFILELEEHHHVEDTFFFPDMRTRVPSVGATLDALSVDHRRLDHLLEQWKLHNRDLADRTVPFGPAHEAITAVALEVRDLLTAHLAIEDTDVLPLYWRHYTAAEYDAVQALAVKKGKKKGMWFIAPWNVDNLEGEAQRAFLAAAPLALRIFHRLVRPRYDRLVAEAFATAVSAS